MRKVLAAAMIAAAALVPLSSASASAICLIVTEDGHQVCVAPPCPAGTVNGLDDKLGDHLPEMACTT